MEKNIIVAVAENNAIGRKNGLLWHLAEDMKYFKETTTGNPVIMGYMTFKSIGRALPRRRNIVISIFPFPDAPEGIEVVSSLQEAFELLEDEERCFIMGGGETYREALPFADNLYITHVYDTVNDADTFFPLIDPLIWKLKKKSELKKDEENRINFEFCVYSHIS